MWIKYFFIVIIFYFLAVLQNSFFTHFVFFGATPNLVFIFFFVLVFFSAGKGPAFGWEEIFYSIVAGLLLDILSYAYFGASLVSLIIISFSAKKIQSTLKEGNDNYPFAYFLLLFSVWFAVYELLIILYLRFLDPLHISIGIDWKFFTGIAYNALFASVIFWIYKKITGAVINNRQPPLFK